MKTGQALPIAQTARGQLVDSVYAEPSTGPSQANESYAYDSNGNREEVSNSDFTRQAVINGPNNRVLTDGAFAYIYDSEGNRTSRTDITTGGTTEYTWDHRNRLVRVDETDPVGIVTQTVEHTYDAFNQWIVREVDPDGATGSAAIERTVFAHDRGQIVLQFDGDGGSDLTEANLSHRYLWGPAVDQLLADEQVDGNTTAGETLWALGDQLGSVRDLVSYDELAEDTVLRKHTAHDSYGRVTGEEYYDEGENPIAATNDAAKDVLFGYTARAFDETTGLQNNLNRWFDARMTTWSTGNYHD